ncbi:hypothetical protein IAG42_21400 [Streptomyces xanthii]|uniref:Uncharacterized protein n=2 Tax=Streptomyces TaxID=1883 RepID=A0A7H1BAY1_9ACTN|nr:hypothetical protein IAG42_21400 [Streptomyces xanthii]
MQKVMTRRGPRRSTRPPARRDSRRPGPGRIAPQAPPHPTELFTERLVLVLSGQKPLHWVARHTVHQAYEDLLWLADRRPLGPARPRIHRIGHFEPSPGSYEVFARVTAGPRLHALAFRLVRDESLRWRCTAVELDGRPPRPHDD